MFGGKIMGIAEGSIGKIAGKTASGLFNFGGANTLFRYAVQVKGYQSGTWDGGGDGVIEYINKLGHKVWRKKDITYGGPSAFPPTGAIFEGEVDNSFNVWKHFYVADCYATVTPTRTATYVQYKSNETSTTTETFITDAVDLYLP